MGKEGTILANGVCQITGVPIGQQVLEASKEGCEPASQNVIVDEGNPVPQGESGEETTTVVCEGGSPVAGETTTRKIKFKDTSATLKTTVTVEVIE